MSMQISCVMMVLFPLAALASDECGSRLENLMSGLLEKSARTMNDGMRVYSPDAGKAYPATWLRDFAYMAESGLVPTNDVVNEALLFVKAIAENGECVDCVHYSGKPCYKPGFGVMGEHAVADGAPFTISVAYLAWRQGADGRFVERSLLDRLVKAFFTMPREENSDLVWIDPSVEYDRCPYGFTDTVRKQGQCLFESLLKYQASIRLAEMLVAAGCEEKGIRLREVAKRIKAEVNVTFWDEKTGLYRAATVRCREHDVWGSAFASWLGVATEERAKRIAGVFRANYQGLVSRGQIRHLLPNVYWEKAMQSDGSEVQKDTYQNGGYWGTATGWFAWTLARIDQELAAKTVLALVDDYERNGACEWHFAGKRACNDGYPANVGILLSVIRRGERHGEGKTKCR